MRQTSRELSKMARILRALARADSRSAHIDEVRIGGMCWPVAEGRTVAALHRRMARRLDRKVWVLKRREVLLGSAG